MTRPRDVEEGRWKGPYIDKISVDPWGNGFVYRFPSVQKSNKFDLYSCGPDGVSHTGGYDLDDITYEGVLASVRSDRPN